MSAKLTPLDIGGYVARPSASASFDAPPHTKSARLSFRLWGAFLQGCGEHRIAGSAVDEFGRGAEHDHRATGREANRVRTFSGHLERAFHFGRALNLAGGGRQKDPLRRLDYGGLGELVHRLPVGPAAAAPLEKLVAILRGIGPCPDQLREALGRVYARDFPPPVRAREAAGVVRPAEREQVVAKVPAQRPGGAEGVMGDGAGAGGEAACCPASGAGVGAGGAVGAGAGGAAASFAAGGAGEGGGEDAAFCAAGAAADEGAGSLATGAGAGGTGVTVAGPGETGGVTFVWLLAVQKTAAIATRTTPPSKAHNQRDMAFPFASLGTVSDDGRSSPQCRINGASGRAARHSPSSICHGAHMTPFARLRRGAIHPNPTSPCLSHGVQRLSQARRRLIWSYTQSRNGGGQAAS